MTSFENKYLKFRRLKDMIKQEFSNQKIDIKLFRNKRKIASYV